jgi:hypothetical protein
VVGAAASSGTAGPPACTTAAPGAPQPRPQEAAAPAAGGVFAAGDAAAPATGNAAAAPPQGALDQGAATALFAAVSPSAQPPEPRRLRLCIASRKQGQQPGRQRLDKSHEDRDTFSPGPLTAAPVNTVRSLLRLPSSATTESHIDGRVSTEDLESSPRKADERARDRTTHSRGAARNSRGVFRGRDIIRSNLFAPPRLR